MRLNDLIKSMLVVAAVTAFAACGQDGSPLGPGDQPTISSEAMGAPSSPAITFDSATSDSSAMTSQLLQSNAAFGLGGWNGLGDGARPFGMMRDCYALCIE